MAGNRLQKKLLSKRKTLNSFRPKMYKIALRISRYHHQHDRQTLFITHIVLCSVNRRTRANTLLNYIPHILITCTGNPSNHYRSRRYRDILYIFAYMVKNNSLSVWMKFLWKCCFHNRIIFRCKYGCLTTREIMDIFLINIIKIKNELNKTQKKKNLILRIF